MIRNSMRDIRWLEEQMFEIWENYFNDIPRENLVVIKFGRRSKSQLGSIKWANKKTRGIKKFVEKREGIDDDSRITVITITSLFKDEKIPDYVVRSTIAHEMIHYAHGFHSPLKQVYKHPHQGGVIRKEMENRGMEKMYKESKKWLKENWRKYLKNVQ